MNQLRDVGRLGVLADDVTGGTDVAAALHRQGLRTLIYFEVPPTGAEVPEHDAIVVAQKIRSVPADQAVEAALRSHAFLVAAGAEQFYWKYCSTFDSTPQGNIGPVQEALAEAVGATVVVGTPSSPEHGRTQYNGYLFVNGMLLSESPMRDHPLNPMRDSLLPRVMDAQSSGRSGLIGYPVVSDGEAAIRAAIARVAAQGVRHVFPDALADDDLVAVARACEGLPLLAGGAGLAGALARVMAERIGRSDGSRPEDRSPGGRAAVIAGSCSRRTLEQLAYAAEHGHPMHRLDVLATPDPEPLSRAALSWVETLDPDGSAPVIYASAPPEELAKVQAALGVEASAAIIEQALGLVATGLAERGVTRFICAGGESSGAVIQALRIRGGLIGTEAARGAPWISTPEGYDVLLKSGNFGEPELLVTATAKGPQ